MSLVQLQKSAELQLIWKTGYTDGAFINSTISISLVILDTLYCWTQHFPQFPKNTSPLPAFCSDKGWGLILKRRKARENKGCQRSREGNRPHALYPGCYGNMISTRYTPLHIQIQLFIHMDRQVCGITYICTCTYALSHMCMCTLTV